MTLGVRILGYLGRLEPPCCYATRRISLLTVSKGCPTETLACWRGGFTSGSSVIFERTWCWLALSSSDGPLPGDVVDDELVLSYILAPFGSVDLWRVSAKVSRHWESRRRGGVGGCAGTSQRKKLYSSLPLTVSVVSCLLGISRAILVKSQKTKVIIFCGGAPNPDLTRHTKCRKDVDVESTKALTHLLDITAWTF